jgi:predicted small secreted protein
MLIKMTWLTLSGEQMSIIKRFLMCVLAALAFSAFLFGGCNTVEGMGRDIQKGGEAIEDAAD